MKRVKTAVIVAIFFVVWLTAQVYIVLKLTTRKVNDTSQTQNVNEQKFQYSQPQMPEDTEKQEHKYSSPKSPQQDLQKNKNEGVKMKLTTIFENNGNIPSEYTCDGKNLAPVLNISDVPKDTAELALIVEDPDAPRGTWTHWILFNLPPNALQIDARNLPKGTKQGITDFGTIGWGGPCPPNGQHRYFFRLFALHEKINLPQGATKKQLEDAMQGQLIEEADLIGLYQRIKK